MGFVLILGDLKKKALEKLIRSELWLLFVCMFNHLLSPWARFLYILKIIIIFQVNYILVMDLFFPLFHLQNIRKRDKNVLKSVACFEFLGQIKQGSALFAWLDFGFGFVS